MKKKSPAEAARKLLQPIAAAATSPAAPVPVPATKPLHESDRERLASLAIAVDAINKTIRGLRDDLFQVCAVLVKRIDSSNAKQKISDIMLKHQRDALP